MNDKEQLDQRVQLAEERTELATERTELASERTQLAAERTLSAWIRTGLAGIGGGMVVIHLLFFKSPMNKILADILGEVMIFWGIFIFVFSFVNYWLFCKKLEAMTGYHTSKIVISTLISILIVSSLLFLIMTIHRLHFLA